MATPIRRDLEELLKQVNRGRVLLSESQKRVENLNASVEQVSHTRDEILKVRKTDKVDASHESPPGRYALVNCGTFRCLGFLRPDGKWIRAYTGRELSGIIGYVFFE